MEPKIRYAVQWRAPGKPEEWDFWTGNITCPQKAREDRDRNIAEGRRMRLVKRTLDPVTWLAVKEEVVE